MDFSRLGVVSLTDAMPNKSLIFDGYFGCQIASNLSSIRKKQGVNTTVFGKKNTISIKNT
jgi:hypothetical protein